MNIYDNVHYGNDGILVVECVGGVWFEWDELDKVRLYGKFLLNADLGGVDCIPLVNSKILYCDNSMTIVYVCKSASISLVEMKHRYRKIIRRKGLTLDKHVKDIAKRVLNDWRAGKFQREDRYEEKH